MQKEIEHVIRSEVELMTLRNIEKKGIEVILPGGKCVELLVSSSRDSPWYDPPWAPDIGMLLQSVPPTAGISAWEIEVKAWEALEKLIRAKSSDGKAVTFQEDCSREEIEQALALL